MLGIQQKNIDVSLEGDWKAVMRKPRKDSRK